MAQMTLDEMTSAIARAERAGDKEAASWMKSQAQERLAGEAGLLVNVGAGMDTMWQGAKKLVGMGMSDEELREKRRIDEMAARSTPGGAAAQLAGEIAPTFLIPGGAGARLLTSAVGRGGLAAGRVSLPAAMGGAALESGAVGALTPTTSDESMLGNVGISAGLGAGSPLLMKALGAGGRGAGYLGNRVAAAIPSGLPGGAGSAERLAEREVAQALERAGVRMDPQRYATPAYSPQHFQPTTAAAYGDEALAPFEKAARTLDAPSWAARDEAQAGARWQALHQGLRGQAEVDAAIARSRGMPPPYAAIDPGRYAAEAARLGQELQQATTTAAYQGNPIVRRAVDTLGRAFRNGTPAPEVLHEFQKTLREGLTGAPALGEAGVRAARSEPFVQSMVQRINQVLDDAGKAGGEWSNWRQRYAQTMREAEGAKAEEQLRRKFVDEHGAPLRSSAGGGAPEVTYAKLSPAATSLRTEGGMPGKNIFSPQANQAVNDVLQDLERHGIVDRVRKAATLGGSDTAHNLTTMAVSGVLADMLFSGGLATAANIVKSGSRHNIDQVKNRLYTDILQDPARFRAFVDAAAQRARQMAQHAGSSGRARYGTAGALAARPALAPDEEERLRGALTR